MEQQAHRNVIQQHPAAQQQLDHFLEQCMKHSTSETMSTKPYDRTERDVYFSIQLFAEINSSKNLQFYGKTSKKRLNTGIIFLFCVTII